MKFCVKIFKTQIFLVTLALYFLAISKFWERKFSNSTFGGKIRNHYETTRLYFKLHQKHTKYRLKDPDQDSQKDQWLNFERYQKVTTGIICLLLI
jgi:hypothetical protein